MLLKEDLNKEFKKKLNNKKEETVREMLKENLDIDLISKITKLSKEEILEIKKSN